MNRLSLGATLASLVMAVLPAAAQTSKSAGHGTPVLVAAWRDDGTLIPYARLDGVEWSTIWPEVLCGEAGDAISGDVLPLTGIPATWVGGPLLVPNDWFGFSWQSSAELLIVQETRRVDAHCCATWGLPVWGAPQPAEHGETQGVALTSREAIQPFVKVDSQGEAGRKLKQFLLPILAHEETIGLRSASRSLDESQRYIAAGFPTSASERAGAPLEAFFVKVAGGDRGVIVSFDLERSYPVRPGDSDRMCGAVSVLSGWLRQSAGGTLTLLEKHLHLTDCDQQDVRARYPFALVQRDGRAFILERRHGYEDESYAVFELIQMGLRLILEKNGGGC